MKASICIASYDHAPFLLKTLESIVCQSPGFDWEIIVVDDGSPTQDTQKVCDMFGKVRYIRIDREPGYRNPSIARNVAFGEARGEVIINQSDDVIHGPNAIAGLVESLKPGAFVIATVHNVDSTMRPVPDPLPIFTGPTVRRPFFFLGALWRRDLYRLGGCDERYVWPGFDDNRMADGLMHGLKLKPVYLSHVEGFHQAHPRPAGFREMYRESKPFYFRQRAACERGAESWLSPGAPWTFSCSKTMEDS